MLNLRLRSTGRKCFQLTAALIQARFACDMNKKKKKKEMIWKQKSAAVID